MQPQPPTTPEAEPAAKRGILRSLWLPWTLTAVLALALAGILIAPLVGSGDPSSPVNAAAEKVFSSPLRTAQSECDKTDGTILEDGSKTLIIDTKGKEESYGVEVAVAACIIDKLKAPSSVAQKIDATNAMQGQQTAEWDDLKASWTYHPDSGLNLIIERK